MAVVFVVVLRVCYASVIVAVVVVVGAGPA